MPTYAELALEPQWNAETLAAPHEAFNERMASHFGLSPLLVGSKGDNNHLYGRHRSRRWDMTSRYCTDRSYGTTDARDQQNDGNFLRATDIGISGQTHWTAAHRLDTAVRAGMLPCVAEWFGTFDGRTVTGWFEGHPSSSDSSHLTHLHVGIWTKYCTDAEQLQLLGDIITGTVVPGGDMFILFIAANVNPAGPREEFWLYDQYGRVDQKPASSALRSLYARGGCPTVNLTDFGTLPNGWTWQRVLDELEAPRPALMCNCDCDCGDSGGGGGVTMDEVRTVINQTRLHSEE